MESSGFWEDSDQAQQLIAECNQLRKWTLPLQSLKTRIDDVKELLPEVMDAGEAEMLQELVEEVREMEKILADLEVRRMLSGELDEKHCYLSINAGAGGTEACDWVQMLARMYQRWGAKRNWAVETIDAVSGEVAGLKSITLKISGEYAFGYAKAERGVHRLVRISPFDSGARRHTSFASVDATPEITDDIQIEVRPEDLRVDTFRASGAGGQHINVTDSAVRITHLPSGVVVSCQAERSQMQNKETCMKMLRSKLYEIEVEEREKKLEKMGGEKKDIAWGSQIRNYVFHPYSLVKDTRTKEETGNVQAVMDGEIDPFIITYLLLYG